MPNLYTLTNKQGLISFGGAASTDYGMVVSEAATFDSPTRKQTIYTVPGRNGSILFQEDAWNDCTRQYRVWLDEKTQYDSGGQISGGTLAERVNAVMAWLNSKKGYQRLEDNFEPDIYRLAYYSGGNEFINKLTLVGEATLTFTCRPERFYKSGETAVVVLGTPHTVDNPTLFIAKPMFYLKGSGTVTLSAGGKTLTITLGSNEDITIDSERMNAYQGTTNKNNQVSGEFPVLVPGTNTIATTGTVSSLQFVPRYYTI